MESPDTWVRVAVCGAHMSGLPLNGQLVELGGELLERTTTAPRYRLFRLHGFVPPRPGMVRASGAGAAIEVEVWRLPVAQYGRLVMQVPAPLCIGTLELADGSFVQGFLCESWATAEAEDISALGGWRAWLARTAGAAVGPDHA